MGVGFECWGNRKRAVNFTIPSKSKIVRLARHYVKFSNPLDDKRNWKDINNPRMAQVGTITKAQKEQKAFKVSSIISQHPKAQKVDQIGGLKREPSRIFQHQLLQNIKK